MKSGEPFRKVIIVVWVRDKVAQSRDDSGGREPLTDLRCIWREPLGLDRLHMLELVLGREEKERINN